MNLQLEQVPPPSDVPVQDIAETLGLVKGLRVEANRSNCRCTFCRKWIRAGESLVFVPDFIDKDDPADIITETCRQYAYNGSWIGCCVSCAPKQPIRARIKAGIVRWWEFWK